MSAQIPNTQIQKIAKQLVAPGKGILAADESFPTIKKRFEKVGIEDSKENRRAYRELLFTTPEIENYISGVIMFDETLRLTSLSEGKSAVKILGEKGILPGIKVDEGKDLMKNSPKEFLTKGLDGLSSRLREYKKLGAKFTKWRALFVIGDGLPSDEAINENAKSLASYAKIVQDLGMVPIVEPEVLMEGTHSLKDSQQANYRVLKRVFLELEKSGVDFSGMLLKSSWVHSGKDQDKPTDKEVAEATLTVLKETVPNEVPGIVFLSGGDSPENATAHLDALNEQKRNTSWVLSFSFGRALQEPVLETWVGKKENVEDAQKELIKRAWLNSQATTGSYNKEMEVKDE